MKQNEVPPNNEQPADKKDVGIESFVPQDSIKGKLRHLLSHTTEMHETTQAHGEAHRNTPPPMAEALQKPRSIADMPSPKHVSEEVLVESFGKQMLTQFKEVGGLYKQIWENPSLLKNALFELARDCVLFPRSLYRAWRSKKTNVDPAETLKESASLALTTSEFTSIPGTYAGVCLLSGVCSIPQVVGTVGSALGNYFGAVIGYALSYLLLSRRVKGYSNKQSFIDSTKVFRDCLPPALALYVADAPLILALTSLGLPAMAAAAVVQVLGMILFLGVAKVSSNKAADAAVK